MKHTFRIERINNGLIVQTYRPRLPGKRGASSDARAIVRRVRTDGMNSSRQFVRVVNMTTGHIVATYEKWVNYVHKI